MLRVKNLLPSSEYSDDYVFNFAEDGTIERSIFEDNFDSVQQLSTQNKGEKNQKFDIDEFYPDYDHLGKGKLSRIELAALFGSVKCFKYFMINEDNIYEDICKFAISGGNNEIIHLCEQKGLQFEDCLSIASMYHHFEIFEWLKVHFYCNEIPLTEFIKHFNEPLFYFYSSLDSNVEIKDEYGCTPINAAIQYSQIEVVKYLHETCHEDIETHDNYGHTPINNAAIYGYLDIVKYLYEICHSNVETKDDDECTPITNASKEGHIEIVKYLYEICHASIEILDINDRTPIKNASLNHRIEVVKYLEEKLQNK